MTLAIFISGWLTAWNLSEFPLCRSPQNNIAHQEIRNDLQRLSSLVRVSQFKFDFVGHSVVINACYSKACSYRTVVEITSKMQPCIRIYCSTVHWRLKMFRAAYRSSSRALTLFAASGLHTHVVTGRSQLDYNRTTWLRPVTTCVCKSEAANTVRAPDDERCAARNMLSLQWTVE